jgi:glycosyltransferase involved in cell wall biosynthesis
VETTAQHRILIAHPSAELYGSDRVALETARACRAVGWAVEVTLTDPGPLVKLLEQEGCSVTVQPAPVLRKSYLSPIGVLRFAVRTLHCTPAMIRLLRRSRPDVVYISTVTVPWWLVLARLAGARVICHVHEAEDAVPRVVRVALATPLLLAHRVVANSEASRNIMVAAQPKLADRTDVIYNGVPGPEAPSAARPVLQPPVKLVLVGRISTRKGTDVAVAALSALAGRGIEATLDLVGGVFPGYEWFEAEVRQQIAEADLTSAVTWSGVQPQVWSALAAADIALVPSRVEPFGNAAVEAMLAGRPVIVGDTQGLREIVRPGDNGELVLPGDSDALADAIERTITNWPAARQRSDAARQEALQRYSPQSYATQIVAALTHPVTRCYR